MLSVTITNEQKIPITLNPGTATGKPAVVDGVPVWSVLDGKCTLEVAPDGLSAFIVSADDDAGLSHVSIIADADLGAGVVDISDSVEATVTGAQAAQLGLSAGAPVPKSTAPTLAARRK